MKSLIKTFDDLPFVVKVILALPGIDFLWGIYRLLKGLDKKNTLLIVVGVIWIFAGFAVLWLVDLITIILYKKPTVLVD